MATTWIDSQVDCLMRRSLVQPLGLHIANGYCQMLDHLSVEFEWMHRPLKAEARAVTSGNGDRFYAAIAHVTRDFLHLEMQKYGKGSVFERETNR